MFHISMPIYCGRWLCGYRRPTTDDREGSVVGGQQLVVDLALFQPSVALSAAMLRGADVAACDARALVTSDAQVDS